MFCLRVFPAVLGANSLWHLLECRGRRASLYLYIDSQAVQACASKLSRNSFIEKVHSECMEMLPPSPSVVVGATVVKRFPGYGEYRGTIDEVDIDAGKVVVHWAAMPSTRRSAGRASKAAARRTRSSTGSWYRSRPVRTTRSAAATSPPPRRRREPAAARHQ